MSSIIKKQSHFYQAILLFIFSLGLIGSAQAATDCAVQTEIPQAECEDLITLYDSTGGTNWRDNVGWKQTNMLCSWFGVTCKCSIASGSGICIIANVTEIDLFGNELSGSIPDFAALTNLQELNLSNNKLIGSIPDFAALTNLEVLNLRSNQLTGSIPDFTALPNLQSLSLDWNQLTGSIPDFTALPNLQSLGLSDNQLTGSIPDFTALPDLLGLYLDDNQLTGSIPDFTALPNLIQLWLHNNQLTGSIPDFIALPKLQELYLSDNQLTGSIPDFTTLTSLQMLVLFNNQLTGSIPDFSLPNLVSLRLENNQLTGSIPDFSLPNLVSLRLENNQLTGSIPDFTALSNLVLLHLENNQLTGSIPDFRGILGALGIRGALTNLRELNLSNNQLTGSIPDFSLPNLLSLHLENNQLTGSIPLFRGTLTNLQELNLSNNQLTGSIPDFDNSDLPNLRELNLSNNQLTGSIPNFIRLIELLSLDLHNNQLTSRIPNFTNLTNLQELNVENNKLTGSIPYFTNLTNLQELNVENNKLTGSIPSFSNITDLQQFYSSGNLLCRDETIDYSSWETEVNIYPVCSVSNELPTANFTISATEGNVPLIVNLDASQSTDSDGYIVSWQWTTSTNQTALGHNQTALGQTASLTFSTIGTHTITLTITDNVGATATAEKTVTVTEEIANQLPTASFTITPNSGQTPLIVNLDASQSTDSDGNIVSWQWTTSTNQTASGQTASLTFSTIGTHTITLTVTDNLGETATAQKTITVTEVNIPNQPPTANFTLSPSSGDAPLTVNLDASQSTDSDGNITSWQWTTSTNQTALGQMASLTFSTIGTHIITLTVTDNVGVTATTEKTVIVSTQTATTIDCAIQTEIPQAECKTLVSLYNSTNGDNWVDNTGWKITNMPCSWIGITCSGGNVTEIDRTSKNLVGTLPNLSTLNNLTRLDLGDNKLVGTIPDLSALSNLVVLSLWGNQLTGSIPDLSALTSLKEILLDTNQFTGNIPNLSLLVNLEWLDLYSNQLTGNISNLSSLTGLKNLRLENNQLTGSIPDLSTLTSLKNLRLENNQLTGSIPDLSALTSLTYLDLSNNSLCKDTTNNYSSWDVEINIYPICSVSNESPTANFTISSNSGQTPFIVNLDASQSTDSDGNIVSWQWTTSTNQTASGQTASLTFSTIGTHTITLTITDNDGEIATTQKTVTVLNENEIACTYSINPTYYLHSSSAQESGSVDINTSPDCDWTVTSDNSWASITSNSSGSGNGTVNYTITANPDTQGRRGTLDIADKTFVIYQSSMPLYPLTIKVIGRGIVTTRDNNTINCNSDCSSGYFYGQSIALIATPNEGWAFSTWSDGCTDGIVVIGMQDNLCIATFKQLTENPDSITPDDIIMNGSSLPVFSANPIRMEMLSYNQTQIGGTFSGGISIDGVEYVQNAISSIVQSAHIKGYIQPIPGHIGKLANLLVVGVYYLPNSNKVKAYYTTDEYGVPYKLDVKDGWPVLDKHVHKQDVILISDILLDIYEGLLPIGRIDIYIGYQIIDEVTEEPIIIYSPSFMHIDVVAD